MARKASAPITPGCGIAGLVLIALLGTCGMRNRNANDAAFEACYGKGIAYFRAIGSYPELSTGEQATTEVIERCKSVPSAFDGLEGVR